MPAESPANVLKHIASGRPQPVYLLQGEDEVEKSALAGEFAGLVEEGLRAFNVERIHAGEMTNGDRLASGIASLIDAARTLPMMSPVRVILVLQAEVMLTPRRESEAANRALGQLESYLEAPEAQTVLVLAGAPLDRRSRLYKLLAKRAVVVECGVIQDQADAERWVRLRIAAAGAAIDPAAARLLAARAGLDIKRLRGDVDRLLLYALGQAVIKVEDVREIAGPAVLQDDWAMTNAIEQRNAADALRQLALMLEAGAPPEKVLGQLGWLVRAKFPTIAPRDLTAAVDAVFRTDLDLKRSAGEPRILLERLVVELCGVKRAGAR
ncbi:MAG: DNA polymerase III subunit delta [Acidobacteriota bacterium]